MAKKDKLVEMVGQHLDAGEQVEVVVAGKYKRSDLHHSGIMVATQTRVVFFSKKLSGFELESYPYHNISSFEQGKTSAANRPVFG